MTPSQSEKLVGVFSKIKRAKRHVIDVQGILKAFFDTNPYTVAHKRDANTRQPIYYISSVKPTDVGIPIVAGDAIHCLRSALDHLAMQFAIAAGATGREKGISFPIGTPAKTKADIRGKIEKGMGQDAVDAIYALEPYQGGAGHDFWMLHELDIIDKHRLLVTVGSYYHSVDTGPMMHKALAAEWAKLRLAIDVPAFDVPVFDLHIRPADKLCPLKAGDEIFGLTADAEIDENVQFSFGVAFHELGVAEAKPVPDTLVHLVNRVEDVVEKLGALL